MTPKPNQFAVMWDCHGLETVQIVPDPALTTFARLANRPPPEVPNILHWRLRAQFNSQRHYEIWILSADPGIDCDDIRAWFDHDPQAAADRVREIGHCFYSNRATTSEKIVIT